MNARDLSNAIEAKLPGHHRGSKETNHWVVIDGKKQFRVTCPKVHAGDVKVGTAKSIREQMRLTDSEFEDFVACTLTGPTYEALIRTKLGLSAPGAAVAPPSARAPSSAPACAKCGSRRTARVVYTAAPDKQTLEAQVAEQVILDAAAATGPDFGCLDCDGRF